MVVSRPPSVNEALWHQHLINLTVAAAESIIRNISASQFPAHPRHHLSRLPSITVQIIFQSIGRPVRG